MKSEWTNEFINQSVHRMDWNTLRIQKCFHDLSEAEVWMRPNSSSNSMGNLILHLCGNIHQYIQSSIGNGSDIRERDAEFAAKGGLTKNALIQKLGETSSRATQIIREMDDESLLKKRVVQGKEYTGIGNVIQVVEHYSYHTGQIAFWTKQLRDKDLAFYSGVDLNKKNA